MAKDKIKKEFLEIDLEKPIRFLPSPDFYSRVGEDPIHLAGITPGGAVFLETYLQPQKLVGSSVVRPDSGLPVEGIIGGRDFSIRDNTDPIEPRRLTRRRSTSPVINLDYASLYPIPQRQGVTDSHAKDYMNELLEMYDIIIMKRELEEEERLRIQGILDSSPFYRVK